MVSGSFSRTLREKCPCSELFWSAFSRIRTEYGDIYSVSLRIQSECEKMQSRITPDKDTFYAVKDPWKREKIL